MPGDHDYFIYMMTNESRVVLYIGMTNDLIRRISEHQRGEIEGFTKDYRVNRLVYYEHYRDVRDAIARETQLKNWSRAKKNTLIERMNPKWNDLSATLGLERVDAGPVHWRDPSTALRFARDDKGALPTRDDKDL